MNTYSKPVIVLLIGSFLLLPVLSTTIYASNNNEEWETGYAVGKRSSIDKFLFLDPPRPDQIFKIHYRVINGTVEGFNVVHELDRDIFGNLLFQVDSNNDAILEIKVPQNYPYAIDSAGVTNPIILAIENRSSVELEYKIDLSDCFFLFAVPLNGNSKIELLWAYPPSPPSNDIPDSCISETVVKDVPVRNDGTISPLHQFRVGVKAEDIVCNEELELLIRSDGKPYCVTPSTAKELKERWN